MENRTVAPETTGTLCADDFDGRLEIPAFPSPASVMWRIQTKLLSDGWLVPVKVYLRPQLSWDGEGHTLAWTFTLITLEKEPNSHATHVGTVEAGSFGMRLALGSGHYCLGSLLEARATLAESAAVVTVHDFRSFKTADRRKRQAAGIPKSKAEAIARLEPDPA
jgi:hypothetical protein